MIFIFAVVYLVSQNVKIDSIKARAIACAVLVLYLVWAVPLAGYRERSLTEYTRVPTVAQTLKEACAKQQRPDARVNVGIYPSTEWYMSVDRKVACK